MRMTQGAVDYRSTADEKSGLMQQPPMGYVPPQPHFPEVPQQGFYAPPPQPGRNPYTVPVPAAPSGPVPAAPPEAPAPPAAAPADLTKPEDAR